MPTPEEIRPHASDYLSGAWREYSFEELGMWVHLLATRAFHRANKEKAAKDLEDAKNYLAMMREKLAEATTEILGGE